MILANAMNPVSLASERWFSEIAAGKTKNVARGIALKAAMIPPINSCLAVGLVSLPGMMTGQILSGTDPLIATRYQILVMLMVVCAGAISSAIFLKFKSSADVMPHSES
jgi:putative ABC transport system permease protein